jgi:hypothetical protein
MGIKTDCTDHDESVTTPLPQPPRLATLDREGSTRWEVSQLQKLGKAAVILGFVLMAIGALGVWLDNPPFSENGTERSAGLVCLVAAIGAGATAALDRRPRGMLIATSAGAIALILVAVDYFDISGTSGAEVGTGLIITLVGAAIATVASGAVAFALFKKPAPAAPTSEHA